MMPADIASLWDAEPDDPRPRTSGDLVRLQGRLDRQADELRRMILPAAEAARMLAEIERVRADVCRLLAALTTTVH